MNIFKRLCKEEEGQGLTEYALVVAGLVAVIIAAVTIFGGKINTFVGGISLHT